MYLPFDRACLAVGLLAEGNSLSSTARIIGIKDSTVQSLLVKAGAGCSQLLRSRIRNFDARHLELDKIWTFVRKKQKHVVPGTRTWLATPTAT